MGSRGESGFRASHRSEVCRARWLRLWRPACPHAVIPPSICLRQHLVLVLVYVNALDLFYLLSPPAPSCLCQRLGLTYLLSSPPSLPPFSACPLLQSYNTRRGEPPSAAALSIKPCISTREWTLNAANFLKDASSPLEPWHPTWHLIIARNSSPSWVVNFRAMTRAGVPSQMLCVYVYACHMRQACACPSTRRNCLHAS